MKIFFRKSALFNSDGDANLEQMWNKVKDLAKSGDLGKSGDLARKKENAPISVWVELGSSNQTEKKT